MFFDRPMFLTSEPVITEAWASSLSSLFSYYLKGRGPLSTATSQANGFYRAENQPKEDRFPYLQLMLVGSHFGIDGADFVRKNFNIKKSTWNSMYEELKHKNGFHVTPTLLHPGVNGELKLKSKDPLDPLEIHGNFLNSPQDIKIILEGIRLVQKFGKTKAFKKVLLTKYKNELESYIQLILYIKKLFMVGNFLSIHAPPPPQLYTVCSIT